MTDAVEAVTIDALTTGASVGDRAPEAVVVAAKIEQAKTTGMPVATSRIELNAAALEKPARIAEASRDRFLGTVANHLAHTQGLCQGTHVTKDPIREVFVSFSLFSRF